jgi:hypothetical protein
MSDDRCFLFPYHRYLEVAGLFHSGTIKRGLSWEKICAVLSNTVGEITKNELLINKNDF